MRRHRRYVQGRPGGARDPAGAGVPHPRSRCPLAPRRGRLRRRRRPGHRGDRRSRRSRTSKLSASSSAFRYKSGMPTGPELARWIRESGVFIRTGPFTIHVRTSIERAIEGIAALYDNNPVSREAALCRLPCRADPRRRPAPLDPPAGQFRVRRRAAVPPVAAGAGPADVRVGPQRGHQQQRPPVPDRACRGGRARRLRGDPARPAGGGEEHAVRRPGQSRLAPADRRDDADRARHGPHPRPRPAGQSQERLDRGDAELCARGGVQPADPRHGQGHGRADEGACRQRRARRRAGPRRMGRRAALSARRRVRADAQIGGGHADRARPERVQLQRPRPARLPSAGRRDAALRLLQSALFESRRGDRHVQRAFEVPAVHRRCVA